MNDLFERAQKHVKKLSSFEVRFLDSIPRRLLSSPELLSKKQQAIIAEIESKISGTQAPSLEEQRLEAKKCFNCNGNLWEVWERIATKALFSLRCECAGGDEFVYNLLRKDNTPESQNKINWIMHFRSQQSRNTEQMKKFRRVEEQLDVIQSQLPKETQVEEQPVDGGAEKLPVDQGNTEALRSSSEDPSKTVDLRGVLV